MQPNFALLWGNHPDGTHPCDSSKFRNQCAIRLGVALEKSGYDTSRLAVRRCSTAYPALKAHAPGHILSAQELADALALDSRSWSANARVKKFPGSIRKNQSAFAGRKGIVFIQNGWGPVDHIDLWDGSRVKGATILPGAFTQSGTAVWFWDLS